MSILDTFKQIWNPVDMQAQPLSLNIKADSPAAFKRNIGRMITLYKALEQADSREEVKLELQARKEACEQYGHVVPQSSMEAEELFTRIK